MLLCFSFVVSFAVLCRTRVFLLLNDFASCPTGATSCDAPLGRDGRSDGLRGLVLMFFTRSPPGFHPALSITEAAHRNTGDKNRTAATMETFRHGDVSVSLESGNWTKRSERKDNMKRAAWKGRKTLEAKNYGKFKNRFYCKTKRREKMQAFIL